MQFKVSGKKEPTGRFWQDPIQTSALLGLPAPAMGRGGDERSDEKLILAFVVCVGRCVLFSLRMIA